MRHTGIFHKQLLKVKGMYRYERTVLNHRFLIRYRTGTVNIAVIIKVCVPVVIVVM